MEKHEDSRVAVSGGNSPAARAGGKASGLTRTMAELVGWPPQPWSGPAGPIGFTVARRAPPPPKVSVGD